MGWAETSNIASSPDDRILPDPQRCVCAGVFVCVSEQYFLNEWVNGFLRMVDYFEINFQKIYIKFGQHGKSYAGITL